MQRIGSRITHEGEIVSVRVDEIRYEDGSTAEREVVEHPGAVAIVAHDDERLYMVRQPREAVGEDSLLELPAGKVDEEDETPLECAQRELVEEVGIEASEWEEAKVIYTSPGFADERCHIFLATGLTRVEAQPDEGERIEVVEVALDELDEAIDACTDAKSLVGLLLFRAR
ncbi:MAG: NUDIX domain-containing protein [Solirubrobacterales bacterium]